MKSKPMTPRALERKMMAMSEIERIEFAQKRRAEFREKIEANRRKAAEPAKNKEGFIVNNPGGARNWLRRQEFLDFCLELLKEEGNKPIECISLRPALAGASIIDGKGGKMAMRGYETMVGDILGCLFDRGDLYPEPKVWCSTKYHFRITPPDGSPVSE